MNDLEKKILDILRDSVNGLKGREIAVKVGVEKKKVNALLYSSKSLNNMCYRDEAYVWHIKEKQEGIKPVAKDLESSEHHEKTIIIASRDHTRTMELFTEKAKPANHKNFERQGINQMEREKLAVTGAENLVERKQCVLPSDMRGFKDSELEKESSNRRQKKLTNQDKVVALFTYIEKLYASLYTKDKNLSSHINQLEWKIILKDIPDSEYVILVGKGESKFDDRGNKVFLSVEKPSSVLPPQLPRGLEKWVASSWNKFDRPISYMEKIDEENFTDNINRVELYNIWKVERDAWAVLERKNYSVRGLFNELYQYYNIFNRDPETYELIGSNGMLVTVNSSQIKAPVLLKRMDLRFDADNNVMMIVDTEAQVTLNDEVIRELNQTNLETLKTIGAELEQEDYQPFDDERVESFIKRAVHQISQDISYVLSEDEVHQVSEPYAVYLEPILFIRRRSTGVARVIAEIIDDVQENGIEYGPLVEMVNPSTKNTLASSDEGQNSNVSFTEINGQDRNIFLSKASNKEQLEIARRIETAKAVLVQGPPGTGKTHTIANLIGHFLSQGKTVLVTSQTSKALSVLKEKLPESIQNMCVAVLNENNKDFEQAIGMITTGLSTYDEKHWKCISEQYLSIHKKLYEDVESVRKSIFTIRNKEFTPIVIAGEGHSPIDIAKFIYANKDLLDGIPGKVDINSPLPVSCDDIRFLYSSNKDVCSEEEVELGQVKLNPSDLMVPTDFEKWVLHRNQYEEQCQRLCAAIAELQMETINVDLEKLTIYLGKRSIEPISPVHINTFSNQLEDGIIVIEEWQHKAILDGKRGDSYAEIWHSLIFKIQDTYEYCNKIMSDIFGKNIKSDISLTDGTLQEQLAKLASYFDKPGLIRTMSGMFNSSHQKLAVQITINGQPLKERADCEIVQKYAKCLQKREQLGVMWNQLIGDSSPCLQFEKLGSTPERNCYNFVLQIEKHLSWYHTVCADIKKNFETMGIIISLKDCSTFISEEDEIKHSIKIIQEIMPLYCQLFRLLYIEYGEFLKQYDQALILLKNAAENGGKSANALYHEFKILSVDGYTKAYNEFVAMYNKNSIITRRKEILAKLHKYAPEWANAIVVRAGLPDEQYMLDHLPELWKWNQYKQLLDKYLETSLDELLIKDKECSKRLLQVTEKIVEALSWYHLIKRIGGNTQIQQSLSAWRIVNKKYGKGTGKNAHIYKREARMLMEKCQVAVPAWIMPINRALDSMSPSKTRFDIVIVDEASQSDISSLPILYLGKKIIVVGDDNQVSPSAINAIRSEDMQALMKTYLYGVIEHPTVYDMKTSLYDIVGMTFPSLMLIEHFRCVPEIIAYSNKLSYRNKIKPLRDASNVVIKPSTMVYRVDGKQNGKTNAVEAECIAALMIACMEQPEYKEQTFGAITLLGAEQSDVIMMYLQKHMSLKEISERKILCGNPAQFQGDERDIIFLSMVYSNSTDGPLTKVSFDEGGLANKQRYNVATSRARNQLWLVHSLDIERDLKANDIRKDLLAYMTNPGLLENQKKTIEELSQSPFEVEVATALITQGYNIVQQWKVGAYSIDMVACYKDKKIAIECDGEKYHSGQEALLADMERQIILERLGWTFIRLRGGEYYSAPDKAINRVVSDLNNLGVYPESNVGKDISENDSVSDRDNDLTCRVKTRVSELLKEWDGEK
ncbi:AAA domain-containing protein [Succinispira mobilis]|uniref:AAA domain-containing protein n=1 Tax=Succinispira mobilis TaxID=78120 RepID=UPI00035D7350|nr:AAA domain-containing protein [Succinispira mobilis]